MSRPRGNVWAVCAAGLGLAGCSPTAPRESTVTTVTVVSVEAREAEWAAAALASRVASQAVALADAERRERELVEALAERERAIDALKAERDRRAFASRPVEPADGDVRLEGCRVIEARPDLGVLAFDGGTLNGVRPGLLVNVLRGDRWVASARVTDARPRVSGARIEKASEAPAVGDRLTVRREAAP